MAQFIYTGGHRLDAPKYTKAFDAWFELNGKAMTIDNQAYIAKLRGNPSFTELDDSLLIKGDTVEVIEATETVEQVITKSKRFK
jgi:hypothetical protein